MKLSPKLGLIVNSATINLRFSEKQTFIVQFYCAFRNAKISRDPVVFVHFIVIAFKLVVIFIKKYNCGVFYC